MARFIQPTAIAVDGATNLYVADNNCNTIRKITPVGTNWVVTTLAGMPASGAQVDGTGSAARFAGPEGVAVDSGGNVYVADGAIIRKIRPAGEVTTLAGRPGPAFVLPDGIGCMARFGYTLGTAVDNAGASMSRMTTGSRRARRFTPKYFNSAIARAVR